MIFQCLHCRALVVTKGGVIKHEEIGVICGQCDQATWLPILQERSESASPSPVILPLPTSLAQSGLQAIPLELPQEEEIAITDTLQSAPIREKPVLATKPEPNQGFKKLQEKGLGNALDELCQGENAIFSMGTAFRRLLEENWYHEGAHRTFVQKAAANGHLPFAGQLYALVSQRFPEEEMSENAKTQILTHAMAQMSSLRESQAMPDLVAKRKKWLWALLFFVAFTALATLILFAIKSFMSVF